MYWFHSAKWLNLPNLLPLTVTVRTVRSLSFPAWTTSMVNVFGLLPSWVHLPHSPMVIWVSLQKSNLIHPSLCKIKCIPIASRINSKSTYVWPLATSLMPYPILIFTTYSHVNLTHFPEWAPLSPSYLIFPLPGRPITCIHLTYFYMSLKTKLTLYILLSYDFMTTFSCLSLFFTGFFRMLKNLQCSIQTLFISVGLLVIIVNCLWIPWGHWQCHLFLWLGRSTGTYLSLKRVFLDEWQNHDTLWPIAFLYVYHYLLFKIYQESFSQISMSTNLYAYTNTRTKKSTFLTINSYLWVDINQLANIIHKYTE